MHYETPDWTLFEHDFGRSGMGRGLATMRRSHSSVRADAVRLARLGPGRMISPTCPTRFVRFKEVVVPR